MKKQKFNKYDLVFINDGYTTSYSTETEGTNAIVLGSYADLYGGDNSDSYNLFVEGMGESAWYEEHQLTLIEKNSKCILSKWKKELKEREKIESDIDWIFSNGKKLFEDGIPGASIVALAGKMGFDGSLWGSLVEILKFVRPFLKNCDKEGFLAACEEIKEKEKHNATTHD